MKQDELKRYQQAVVSGRPRVHCITNTITIWDCANILLAAGASPTMAHHAEEVAEITTGCHALVCNFGAMNDYEAMLNAAPAAAAAGHPIVVDPVGCGGSSFRRGRFFRLAQTAQITCVRGNASEIRALALGTGTVAGVDSLPTTSAEEFEELKNLAKHLAVSLGAIVIASGVVDIVTDGRRLEEVTAGDSMMRLITGSGCMSSVLLGAYLAVGKEDPLAAAAACVTTMGDCGARAAARARAEGHGTMTFHTYLIDEMSLIGALS